VLTITQALLRWGTAGGRGAKAPRESSVCEARRAVGRFVELHGDLPITAVTRAHARAFRDAWAKTPKALPVKLQRLPLPELLRTDLRGLPQRNAQSVNKSLTLLSAVLSRAAKDGYFDQNESWSNPFRIGFEIAAKDREPYEPFTSEELRKLFASPVFAAGERPVGGRGEAAFWLPVIALYSGARRTEIAQLKARDVRQSAEGLWFFDFTASDDDQSVKNLASARVTPVHPELIGLSLLDYVQSRLALSSKAALWPGFQPSVDRSAASWTKWFGRYLGAHVTENPRKTFHSFRHTFKRACRDAGIPEEIHAALTGHAMTSVGQQYGRERRDDGTFDRGVPLSRLAIEIAKISYPGLRIDRCLSA
jgi:integrase